MKVSQLIAHLEKIEDKERQIEVPIRVSTRAHPVAYVGGLDGGTVHEPVEGPFSTVRLTISMPDGFIILQRKKS